MVDYKIIKECFSGLIGWRESSQAPNNFEELIDEHRQSDSGVYVNDIPGINLDIINDTIGHDNCDVNEYLTNVYESSISELINKFVIRQKQLLNTKALLHNFSIGTSIGNIRDYNPKRSRFVGFELRPTVGTGVTAKISQIGIQLSQPQDFTIYLYASSQLEPIKTFSFEYDKMGSLVWRELEDFIISYCSNNTGNDDIFYIGYYEDDLEEETQIVDTRLSCYTCTGSAYSKYNKYLGLRTIEVSAGNTYLSREIFDVESIGYSVRETHGLHLKLNVECDITDVLCENKMLFVNLLQKTQAIKVFWDIYNSDRLNRGTLINKDDARLNAEKLEIDFDTELKTIIIDVSNIDEVCLPCRRDRMSVFHLR